MDSPKSKKIIDNPTFFSLVEDVLNNGESIEILVKGISMEPTLSAAKGDKVLLSPISSHSLYIGAIALFRYNNQHILHRLVKIDKDLLIFQGDNVISSQEMVYENEVVAIVERIIRSNTESINCFDELYIKKAGLFVKSLHRIHSLRRMKNKLHYSRIIRFIKKCI